jgi:hypothetical protein
MILSLLGLVASSPAGHHASGEPVDFAKQIAPILQSKCQPCHYSGGKMYAKLPFDRPATIVTLGEKLFTRIHDEQNRAVIRRFLAENKR